jgi:peptide/nickel transport system substrate-binding protein
MNVERGESQVALGLSGDQITNLSSAVELTSASSATVIFLLINANPAVSSLTSQPQFVQAVKSAIDYAALGELAGAGSVQATSLIPNQFMGALPASQALTFDLEKATADAAAVGAAGQTVTLSFPNDADPTGLPLANVAQRLQAQLAAAGITVELAPALFATEIDAYRSGTEQIGLWYWNPDYMDPANYLAFGPGQTVGLRAGWPTEADPAIAELVTQGYTTGDPAQREALFEAWGLAMNADSPFVPLLQPASNVVSQPSVTNVHYNPVWIINVAGLGRA